MTLKMLSHGGLSLNLQLVDAKLQKALGEEHRRSRTKDRSVFQFVLKDCVINTDYKIKTKISI